MTNFLKTTKQAITNMQLDIEQLRHDMQQNSARLEIKIAHSKVEFIKWYIGTIFVFASLLVAVMTLL